MKIELILLFITIPVVMFSGCVSQGNSGDTSINVDSKSNVEKVEVIHFHATHQCYSCITLGSYTEEIVNTYFSKEVKNGKLSFSHINVELPQNKEITEKYGATGSSLWIGVYDDSGFHKEENFKVWYKITDKEDFVNYTKNLIEKRLNGELD